IQRTDFDELGLNAPPQEESKIEHRLFQLSHVIDFLSKWEQKRLAEKILLEKPKLSISQRKETLQFGYVSVLEKAESLEKTKKDILNRNQYLIREKSILKPFESLDIPILLLKPTELTEMMLGSVPLSRLEKLRDIQEKQELWLSVIHQGKREVQVLVIYLKEKKEEFEESLREVSLNPFYFSETVLEKAKNSDCVTDVIKKLGQEIKKGEEKAAEIDKQAEELSLKYKEKLMLVYDSLLNERNKNKFSSFMGETKNAFFLEGWIQEKEIGNLKQKLETYSESVEYFFRLPLPDEEPPVVLDNPPAGKPFEIVTKLYGLPGKGSLDPTLYLAPFFFVFLGLTVSEAGYGLVVTILSLLYLRFAKPKGGLRLFMKLLAIVGMANIFLGSMVGGWFGFPVPALMVIDPLNDPLSFLILSLVLGFIQVWFGTLLRMITDIKQKKYLKAIFVQGGWLVLLPSLVLYLLTKVPVWGYLSIGGALGIVFFASPNRNPLLRFFGGLYGLYDISRYLSDVLSYSRLLALGLATTVIAMVVNTLCESALGVPWIGWLFAAVIFVIGHLFNLGISFLGGFVHSMRLQFVEFFSKFFDSGGQPFKPFELENEYTEFIET
ncbi:MAG TPA: V-type ATPase 116kDa subunit family protein, partial [Acidobacteriota bacterium]|nr:V-type ATPase 116kDa subunit family protein [Acidobacteriota bacterium]